jgi:hypothetical protein
LASPLLLSSLLFHRMKQNCNRMQPTTYQVSPPHEDYPIHLARWWWWFLQFKCQQLRGWMGIVAERQRWWKEGSVVQTNSNSHPPTHCPPTQQAGKQQQQQLLEWMNPVIS